MVSSFRAAIAQYPVSRPASWADAADHLSRWTAEAAAQDARLLVFPEYAAMSLAGMFAPQVHGDLHAQLHQLQQLREDYVALHRELARRHGAYLLAGSFPWQVADGRFHNRAWLFTPDGAAGFQDKRVMTRFERERWSISAASELKVFATDLGRIGVQICYDAEFPLPARAQAEAGAQLLLVPSCTDAEAGHNRVRVAARARALENQCYALLSPLVGEAPWSPAVDVNVGAAGAYSPPDLGFPADGVLAQGQLNQPGWIYAELDLEAVARVRREGQVLNFEHWPEQGQTMAQAVLVEKL
ncbi:MAG: carbon-nitrogen hydrolase family protein [Nevskia sp.]|nr:carbon-nitrogen hydrolase family protein [Nevskia sp.]